MLTLTGVVVGVIDADGVEDEGEPTEATEKKKKKKWNENAHAVVAFNPPNRRILRQVYLPEGFTQDRFRIDEEAHLRVDVASPKKGELRWTLLEIVSVEDIPWKPHGKVRRNGTEHPAEPLAGTQ